MSRVRKQFEKKKKLFIGYLTAGDGDSLRKFQTLLDGGVDLLEIGVPFSDPIADGPIIQKAMHRSLSAKTNFQDVFHLIRELREKSEVPMILFTYYNPIQSDLKGFLTSLKEAGADGILIVDLPIEEADEYRFLCKKIGLDPIFVIAPTTPLERIRLIAKAASGFLYYACRKGTTGIRSGLPSDLPDKIEMIRKVTDLPIAVGFGIADRKTAEEILKIADAFVVGSYFVEEVKRVYDFRM